MKSNARWWPLAVLVAVVLVNLPLGHSMWINHRLDSNKSVTTAEVVATTAIPKSGADQRFFVTWRFDREIDPEQTKHTGQVTESTYREAESTEQIAVEYLPGKPSSNRPIGRVSGSKVGVAITLGGNLTILAVVLLMLWVRRTTRFEVLATADVVRCKPPELLREDGDEVVVRGEVAEIGDGQIVLLCGGRRITVILGEHTNPIGYQQYAEVRGRRLA